jgi:hypothetical protein
MCLIALRIALPSLTAGRLVQFLSLVAATCRPCAAALKSGWGALISSMMLDVELLNVYSKVNGETRPGSVGRNCKIRVPQYLIAWVQFRCGDCSPLAGFQVVRQGSCRKPLVDF